MFGSLRHQTSIGYDDINMTMKKISLTFLFFCIFNSTFSQNVFKWRATDYSSRVSIDGGESWGQWGDWTPSGVLIMVRDDRVNIYSSTPQVYDVIGSTTKTNDDDGNPILSSMCVDASGTRCRMTWYFGRSGGNYVIFKYKDLEFMYSIIYLD